MTDKNALKVVALKESISKIVADYEEKIVDLRADITIAVEDYENRISALEAELQPYRNAQPQEGTEEPDVVS